MLKQKDAITTTGKTKSQDSKKEKLGKEKDEEMMSEEEEDGVNETSAKKFA